MNMANEINKPSQKSKIGVLMLLVLLLVFLGSLNFVGKYYYCMFGAFAFFIVAPERKLKFNASFVWLLLLSVSMCIFNENMQGTIPNIIRPFVFPLCYLIGYCLLSLKSSLAEHVRYTHIIAYMIAGGSFLHLLLNMIVNGGMSANSVDRNTIDFWSREVLSATGQAALACVAIGVIAAFFFSSVRIRNKIVAAGALIVLVLYNFVIASRTMFVLLLIMLAVACLHQMIAFKRKIFKLLFIVLVIVLVVMLIYQLNVFGIKSIFKSSNLYDRFFSMTSQEELDDDTRLAHKKAYLRLFSKYPLGGGNIRAQYGHSAHDLYLDTYDESSIFAFVFIIVYIFLSLSRLYKCFKSKRIPFETRQLIVCVYIVINIQFWLEPIMRGMPWLLSGYCMFDGIVTALLQRSNISE